MITLIRGGWLVAYDGTQHRIVPKGEVAIEGDRVIYAGPKYPGAAERVVERDSWLVSPGLINLHGHVGVEFSQPFVDIPRGERFAPSREFIERQSLFMEASLTLEEQQLSAEHSLVQMMKCGATTVVDSAGGGTVWWLGNGPQYEEMLVDTAGRLGARAYLSSLIYRSARSYVNQDGSTGWVWDEEMGMEGLQEAVRFCRMYRGAHNGLISGILCPNSAFDASPDLLRATKAVAMEQGLPIQLHTAGNPVTTRLTHERYGCTVIEHLDRIGFLGPEVILGHCILISGHPDIGGDPDGDLRLIADSGASVAHSPLPFARFGVALWSLPRYLQAGVNVGIGCDVWPVDIIGEMRLAWMVGKIIQRDNVWPTAHQVFDCATLGGAHALQRDDLGRLAPGALADIICVDLGRYHTGPVVDPIRALLTCAKGQDVEVVFINGQEVITDGRVLNADEERLQQAAGNIMEKLLQVAAAREGQGRNACDLLCPGWQEGVGT